MSSLLPQQLETKTVNTTDSLPADTSETMGTSDLLNATTNIVVAALKNNMPPAEAVSFATSIYQTLASLSTGDSQIEAPAPIAEKQEPAVSIRSSVKPDYIVCLEDGKKLKMLKRHLMTHYQMTPEQYRTKWNLPKDYPMTAPSYTEQRRDLAKKIGLGRKPNATNATAAPKATGAKRGRPSNADKAAQAEKTAAAAS
jgi:predicted transcriptional regulator